ncbi:MAG TPA: HAD family hydrolase, partial [Puia sp.]|nr:HAD family hydrolase [Puia sp.]
MTNNRINSSQQHKAYRHLFFDLDHTIWDFEANSKQTLLQVFHELNLKDKGVDDFEQFHKNYLGHNDKLWERYRNGFIKVDELRWKRMWLTLLDFKNGDESLAREMGNIFLELLPTRKILFPHATEILTYLTGKKYQLHLITNGFEKTQHSKLKNSGIDKFFLEVITSESSNSLKPHKEIFDYALSKT